MTFEGLVAITDLLIPMLTSRRPRSQQSCTALEVQLQGSLSTSNDNARAERKPRKSLPPEIKLPKYIVRKFNLACPKCREKKMRCKHHYQDFLNQLGLNTASPELQEIANLSGNVREWQKLVLVDPLETGPTAPSPADCI